jgi:hypothetical protein
MIRVGRIYQAINDDLDPALTWRFQVLAEIERKGKHFFVAIKLAPLDRTGSLFVSLFDENGVEVGEDTEAVPGEPFELLHVTKAKPVWNVI